MCNCVGQSGGPNFFGGPGMMGGGQMNPLQMIMQILMQILGGMMGMGGMPGMGGGGCGGGGPMMSPGFNPNFGGGGGGCGCGGGGGFNPGNFLGGGPGGGGYVPGGGGGGYNPGGGGVAPFNANGLNGPINASGQPGAAVNWALSQEGVSERNNPDVVRGYSRGRWQAWCADFVSTAYERTGGSPWGHQSSVQGILNWGRNNPGHFLSANAARQNPGMLQAGDVVVWKQNGRSHVGLLQGVNRDGTFRTIEGNTSDRVAQRTHSFSSSQLTGFVRGRGTFGGN